MKGDLNTAVAPMLTRKTTPSAQPVHYWFQYQGKGSGSDRTILLIGHPFPVSAGAEHTLYDVFIPESCVIFAIYVPLERRFKQLEVGGLSCPPRI